MTVLDLCYHSDHLKYAVCTAWIIEQVVVLDKQQRREKEIGENMTFWWWKAWAFIVVFFSGFAVCLASMLFPQDGGVIENLLANPSAAQKLQCSWILSSYAGKGGHYLKTEALETRFFIWHDQQKSFSNWLEEYFRLPVKESTWAMSLFWNGARVPRTRWGTCALVSTGQSISFFCKDRPFRWAAEIFSRENAYFWRTAEMEFVDYGLSTVMLTVTFFFFF